MEKNKVTVFVCGQKLTLLTSESEKYVNDIASKVETTVNSLFSGSNMSKEKCAIMAALDFCDDEYKARAAMNEIKEQIKDYIEDTAKLREENAQLKAEIEKLNEEKKLLLNSKKTMIASAVEIKHEVKEENTEEPASEISADDDLSFEDVDKVAEEVKEKKPVLSQSASKNEKKRHEHKHVNPFKERFKNNNDKGYTPVRQYSLFDENK